MRVFLDTNVIVGSVAARGLCADVMREVLVNHRLIVSETLLDEVESVLRSKIGVPPGLISELLHLLRESSLLSESASIPDLPNCEHNDKAFVSAALNAKADVLVTGDKALLDVKGRDRMEIVSPRMFWEKVKGPSGE